jgi:hypothetical protein
MTHKTFIQSLLPLWGDGFTIGGQRIQIDGIVLRKDPYVLNDLGKNSTSGNPCCQEQQEELIESPFHSEVTRLNGIERPLPGESQQQFEIELCGQVNLLK